MAQSQTSNLFCSSEQAHKYVQDPSKADSKRGLKRTWVDSNERAGTSSTPSDKSKPRAAEKGK